MERNIRIVYLLTVLKNSWFWLGIWVFYYRIFTNYAGMGILEMGLYLGTFLGEIPSGAIADLLGKKFTLIIAFFTAFVGLLGIAFTPNFLILALSVFIAGIGMSFYSGTMDALVYDSLKQQHKESDYAKVVANIGSLQLIAPAVASVIGGLVYAYSPRLPFLFHGLSYFSGFVACFFLIEPKIDTVKFNFNNFIIQTKSGFSELTKNSDIRYTTLILVAIGAIIVIADELVNGILGVEFGFNAQLGGVFWAVAYIISALSSQVTSTGLKIFRENKLMILVGSLIAVTFVISPFAGLVLGGFSLIFRSALQVIFTNISSIAINNNTESKYRATTLSTFNLIKNIPYFCLAYLVGFMADKYSAKIVSLAMGIILFLFLLFLILKRKTRELR